MTGGIPLVVIVGGGFGGTTMVNAPYTRNANDIPSLLILKTIVQNYTPGSETRPAVTTVNGATKLNVRIQ
jgi:NADH dehydrogenase FAD-containing subunit